MKATAVVVVFLIGCVEPPPEPPPEPIPAEAYEAIMCGDNTTAAFCG
jgi:hypothetical protein